MYTIEERRALSLPPFTTQTHSHTTPSSLPPPTPPPQGISANEVINFFFDKETRLEWEGTLESVDIVEALTEDTIIFHQLHKRVWPSTQRETLFCSHLCTLPNAPRPENMVGHTWMVCNFSIDHDDVPVSLSVWVALKDGKKKSIPNTEKRPVIFNQKLVNHYTQGISSILRPLCTVWHATSLRHS